MVEPNVYEKDTRKMLEGLEVRLAKDLENLWEIIEKLRNRLPLWATFLISGLCAIIGWLLKATTQGG